MPKHLIIAASCFNFVIRKIIPIQVVIFGIDQKLSETIEDTTNMVQTVKHLIKYNNIVVAAYHPQENSMTESRITVILIRPCFGM